MNSYITGAMIKRLREEKRMTQAELAEKLNVSDKAVSKWETGKGYPDITLVEPIAAALGVSVPELLSGENVTNRNRSANLLRGKWYVCPVCGNILHSTGEAVIACCGVTLPPLEPEAPDEAHEIGIEPVEDEIFVSLDHEMTREHYISFVAAVMDDRVQLVKLYPEGSGETRFPRGRIRYLYAYCNRHGLFRVLVKR